MSFSRVPLVKETIFLLGLSSVLVVLALPQQWCDPRTFICNPDRLLVKIEEEKEEGEEEEDRKGEETPNPSLVAVVPFPCSPDREQIVPMASLTV